MTRVLDEVADNGRADATALAAGAATLAVVHVGVVDRFSRDVADAQAAQPKARAKTCAARVLLSKCRRD